MEKKNKLKQGDKREDGMVFWCYNKQCKNGEYWITPKKFKENRNKGGKAWRKWRNELMKNDDYRNKENERHREWRSYKMKNDPDFKEKQRKNRYKWNKDKLKNDPLHKFIQGLRRDMGRIEKGNLRTLEIYGVQSRHKAFEINQHKLSIYHKYFKGIEYQNDHMRPIAKAKNKEDARSRCHFANTVYIPAQVNMNKSAKPFWEWFATLTDENLKKCIAEQDAYNKKIQRELALND